MWCNGSYNTLTKIDGLEAPAAFLEGDLRAFAAVDEQLAALVPKHEARQPAIGERHHAAGSRKANVQHDCHLAFRGTDHQISVVPRVLVCIRVLRHDAEPVLFV